MTGRRRQIVADPLEGTVVAPGLHRDVARILARIESKVAARAGGLEILRERFDAGRCVIERIRRTTERGTVAAAEANDNATGKHECQNVA